MRFAKIILLVCFNIIAIQSLVAQQDTTKKNNGNNGGGNEGAVIASIDNCVMNGPASVLAGNTHSYWITCDGGDGATSWQITGGTLNASDAWNANVTWGSAGVGEVRAKKGASTQAYMDITISAPPPLVGGTISNATQSINYNTTPAIIRF